ncbi:hypothetical protein AVEN_87281-1 [Araneus ventricosus]|uniref:MADF domain-containing protein n=1 Tax=Araneus ventricosus TaxID=182803 RepID=A0A4Y2ECY0_ARAVE|nr:hypothetical protein AVEN_87281-1 [Araneus ventricosus]
MDKRKMTQRESIRLIELYKSYPLLYNPKDMNYRNKAKRAEAWDDISKTMNMPASELRKKMSALMGTYRSEKSRENKRRQTGSGAKGTKWYAFKYFDFLDHKESPGETMDSESEIESDETLDSELLGTSAGVQIPTTSNAEQSQKRSRKRRRGGDGDARDGALKMQKLMNDLTTNSFFVYGQHIANELRKYDPLTLAHVKKAFAEVLFKADVGTLVDRSRRRRSESSISCQSIENEGRKTPTFEEILPQYFK